MRQGETLKSRARTMRIQATPAEQKLWLLLRAHRFEGAKFTQQVPSGPYILDCAARAAKLASEIDGDTHGGAVGYDAARTAYLERQGYRVIRFTNAEVMGNIERVAAAIATLRAAPSPQPSPRGGREQHTEKALSPRGAGGERDGSER